MIVIPDGWCDIDDAERQRRADQAKAAEQAWCALTDQERSDLLETVRREMPWAAGVSDEWILSAAKLRAARMTPEAAPT